MAHCFDKKWRSNDVKLPEKADFSVMLLSDPVLVGLKKAGFITPSPIQLEAIPIGRFGKDLLVQAKSGTGKTLVFTVIALEHLKLKLFRPQVLIVAPTREIATQICSVIHSVGTSFHKLTCCSFIGGLPLAEDKERGSTCQIAVGTPGRLRQLIKLGSLPTNSIRLLVFDEADQLFQGTFKPEMDDIFKSLPEDKQVITTSATYPPALRKVILKYMRDPFVACINSNELSLLGIVHYIGVVQSSLMPLLEYNNKLVLLEKVLTSVKFSQCLVFCNMVSRVEVLCRDIKKWGFAATYISSAKQQADRLKVLDRLKHFKCKVVVSSDVTSRGIDAENVDLVINFDLAHTTETYLHRVGRAGRYGSIGLAVSIVTEKEIVYLENIEAGGNFKSYKLPDTLPEDLIRNPYLGQYTIKENVSDSEIDSSSSDGSCLISGDISNDELLNNDKNETNEEIPLDKNVLSDNAVDSNENIISDQNSKESRSFCSENKVNGKVLENTLNKSTTFSKNHNGTIDSGEPHSLLSDTEGDVMNNGTASVYNDISTFNGEMIMDQDMSGDLLKMGVEKVMNQLDTMNSSFEVIKNGAVSSENEELKNEQKDNNCFHSSNENLIAYDETLQKFECDHFLEDNPQVITDVTKVTIGITDTCNNVSKMSIGSGDGVIPAKGGESNLNLIIDNKKKCSEIELNDIQFAVKNYLRKIVQTPESIEINSSDVLCENDTSFTECSEMLMQIQSEKCKLLRHIFQKFEEDAVPAEKVKFTNDEKCPTEIMDTSKEYNNAEVIDLMTESVVPCPCDEQIPNVSIVANTEQSKRPRRKKKCPKKQLSDLMISEDTSAETIHSLGNPKLQSTPGMSTNSVFNKMLQDDSSDECLDDSDVFKKVTSPKIINSNSSPGSSISPSENSFECADLVSQVIASSGLSSESSKSSVTSDNSSCSDSKEAAFEERNKKLSRNQFSNVRPQSSYRHHLTNGDVCKNDDLVRKSRRMNRSSLRNSEQLPSAYKICPQCRNCSQPCFIDKPKLYDCHSSQKRHIGENHGHFLPRKNVGRNKCAQSVEHNVPLQQSCHAWCHCRSPNTFCSYGVSHLGCTSVTAVQPYDIYYEQWKFIQSCVNSSL